MSRVAYLDTETTGTNPERDQVIELGVAVFEGERHTINERLRFRPQVSIHPEALAVHGISEAELRDAPTFDPDVVTELLDGVDYVAGYNVDFDLQMLEAEFKRVGHAFPLAGVTIIDALKLWRRLEPRTLAEAHKRFAGVPLKGAHNALNDALAVRAVLRGMMVAFDLTSNVTSPPPHAWETIADLIDPERRNRFGTSTHLLWVDGVLTVNFGKHAGRGLYALARTSRGYLEWMLGGTFPPTVKDACRMALGAPNAEAFHAWARNPHKPQAPTQEREREADAVRACDEDRMATLFMPGDGED